MGTYGKGMVEIPLEDFWEIVSKFSDPRGELYLKYGVPRVNNSNQTIEIDYMFNSEIPVEDQYGDETCDISNQWKNNIDKL